MTRRTKFLASISAAVLVLGVAYVFWLRSSDTSKYYEYATYADLKRDPTVAAASVPEFVPPSARNIWGWYDVDFNVSAVEFEFEDVDRSLVARSFQRALGDQQSVIERKVRTYDWKHEVPRGAGIETFSGDREGTEYLIIDSNNSRAYYVSEP